MQKYLEKTAGPRELSPGGHLFDNTRRAVHRQLATRIRCISTWCAIVLVLCCTVGWAAPVEEKMETYLQAVRTFADNVLEHGRDHLGPKMTPLFVDGLDVDTLKPPVWKKDGDQWVLSNLASQQNLLRVLDGLTDATGDRRYRDAAVSAVDYAFRNVRDSSGMLYWGGHCCYDALGDRIVGESKNHEYKRHYPYYELMWQVDPNATREHIEAVWAAHVIDWRTLDFNRHGKYGGGPPVSVWEQEYVGGKVPFAGKGLTFMMSATDLIYAAAQLTRLSGDERPLVWAKRLGRRYVEARHPETGLGACNFTTIEPCRMNAQFPQFEGRFTEATVTDIYGMRYSHCAFCQLRLGEALGDDGRDFVRWGIEDLTARANHGYDEATNSFQAMLIDGTRLSPEDRVRDGYVETRWLQPRAAGGRHFLAYCAAYRLSSNDLMWQMARRIGIGIGVGTLGLEPGTLDSDPEDLASRDPMVIFGLLELHQATGSPRFLRLAERVADNALAQQFHKGFFVQSKDHVIARFDDPLPLALLHLRASVLGLKTRPPVFWMGEGYLHCPHDGVGRTYDHTVIYSKQR